MSEIICKIIQYGICGVIFLQILDPLHWFITVHRSQQNSMKIPDYPEILRQKELIFP